MRQVGTDTARALAGPLLPDSGLAFTYFDASGDTTTTASEVGRVEIFLRGLSAAPVSGGISHLTDSSRVMVDIRN